jgi:site-specific recombinase XerD
MKMPCNNLNILRWIAIAIQKDMDSITEDDFDIFLNRLEVQGKDNSSYKKAIKKFFRFQTDDNPPK